MTPVVPSLGGTRHAAAFEPELPLSSAGCSLPGATGHYTPIVAKQLALRGACFRVGLSGNREGNASDDTAGVVIAGHGEGAVEAAADQIRYDA